MTQRTQGLTATVLAIICCCLIAVVSIPASTSRDIDKATRAEQAKSIRLKNPAVNPSAHEERSQKSSSTITTSQKTIVPKEHRSMKRYNDAPAKPEFSGTPTHPNEDVYRQGGDNIASAFVIGSLPFYDAGTTSGYNDDYDEACPYTGSTSADVVYSFTPGSNAVVDIDLCPSGYDTKVYVYENAAGNTIACNDDAAACALDYRSQLLGVPLTGGNTYYIVVDGYGGDDGNYDLAITENVPCIVDCPVNHVDEGEACGDTINDGCNLLDPMYGEVKCGDTICGTAWAEGDLRDTDWFLKTLEGDTSVTWCGTANFDFALIIARVDGCGEEDITIVDINYGLPCDTVCLSATLGAGTYVFFVAPDAFEGYSCAGGPWNYTVWLDCAEAPAGPDNNTCANATPVGDVVDYAFTNIDATTDGPAACTFFGYSQVDADVWFCYTASCDGIASVSLCGSDFDTKIAVYDGCSCPVTIDDMIACNEDACDLQSEVVFPVVSGNTYLLRIGGYEGDQGNGVLNITCGGAAQDDNCVDVTPQTLPAVFVGDNTNATNDCELLAPDKETWAAFTIDECTNVKIELCGTTPPFEDGYIVLFDGCPCGAYIFDTDENFDDCGDGNLTFYWDQLPAGTYYYPILSDAAANASGPYTVTITGEPCPPGYCTASGGCDEYISRVVVGSIDNSSACDEYADYTSLSTSMDIGVGYPISVENGNGYSSDQCGIWVDWNHDDDFLGPDEVIAVSGTPSVGPYSAVITPPAGALPGPTTMRIRITYTGAVAPCGATTYGEVEDYTIEVTGGEIGANLTVEPDSIYQFFTQAITPIDISLHLGNDFAPGYDVNDINLSTVTINGDAPSSSTVLGAYAGFDGPVLELSISSLPFIMNTYFGLPGYSEQTATVSGEMNDATPFSTVSETFVYFGHSIGDLNKDTRLNILDVTSLVSWLFAGGVGPIPTYLGDIDGNGKINILDVNRLVGYLFAAGPPPVYHQ